MKQASTSVPKKKTRRGNKKRRIESNEKVGQHGSLSTKIRKSKRSDLGSKTSSIRKIEQRTRRRSRKRQGIDVPEIDPQRRVRLGPKVCEPNLPEPKLPEFLENIPEDKMFDQTVLKRLVRLFQKEVFDVNMGTVNIETRESTSEFVAAYCSFHSPECHTITLIRENIRSKMCLYNNIAHEMCHAYIHATTNHDDHNHGNIFQKTCLLFLAYDCSMDVYDSARSDPNFLPYTYECKKKKCALLIHREHALKSCPYCRSKN